MNAIGVSEASTIAISDTVSDIEGIVLYSDSDVYAGTEAHILTLARALRGIGVDCGIASPAPSPLEAGAKSSGLQHFPIAKIGLVDRAAIKTLAALIRSERIRIIHTHNGRTHLNAALAIQRAGRGKCIATQHFISPDHSTGRGLKAVVYALAHRWVNRRTSHFITVSQAVRQGMIERHEAPEGRITVVPNGIEALHPRSLTPPAAIRAELGISLDAPIIVCTARLEKEKDVATLLSAMKRVAGEFPSARCLVAGEGAERGQLEGQIRSLGLEQEVKLLGYRKDAHSLIQAADIFVLPSLAEPFGLVILEAMSLGRPVVATRAGGPLEIVVDGKTGVLAKPANPQSLASSLLRLLQCPAEAAQMGASGRARFIERFQSSHMAEATRQVYMKCLDGN
jgi:glycosyltransferase involved in cell wall biosynthesis